MSYILSLASKIKEAQSDIAKATTAKKNEILYAVAQKLIDNTDEIIKANEKDMSVAAQNGISPIMLDRLMINKQRVEAMAEGVKKVAKLPDPVGEVLWGKTMPNGLRIKKQRIPIGVIGIIYESRPNVTADAAALCIKSSNAVMLRGGKEAINTNIAIVKAIKQALESVGINPNIVGLVEDTSRESSAQMMRLKGMLDVLIPRGGAGLIKSVIENSIVPVIETGSGNCHIYVDETADIEMAKNIVFNAKTSRPSVCNACESMLVHKKIADKFLPEVKKLLDTKLVIILGCEKTREILGESINLATEDDYYTEFLDYVLSVKVVEDIDEAISHIAKYSTGHSESIITNDLNSAQKFTDLVDSAAVYVNASTRFTDGDEFGFGAEIGISTQKLHARGPMGLSELTSFKYVVYGDGQIR